MKKGAVLSETTRDTLERAIKRGVHVVIATGRVFSALPESIFDIEGLEYVITSNGAHITRLKDMKRIYSDYPSETSMEEVRDILTARREYPIEVFTDGAAYIDPESIRGRKRKRLGLYGRFIYSEDQNAGGRHI